MTAVGRSAAHDPLPGSRPPGLSTGGLGVLGTLIFLSAWEAAGRGGWLGRSWPPLSAVIEVLLNRHLWGLFGRATGATGREALLGYGAGVCIAGAMAGVSVVSARTAQPLQRFAAIVNSVPVLAIGPVVLVVIRDRSNGPVIFSALAVFFATFVAAGSALAAVPEAQLDVMRVTGASDWVRFWRVQLPSALPGIVNGLRLAAPAALLGAVLGEWFGADRGIGLLLVASMQNLNIEMLWAAALLGAGMSASAYGALSLAQRVIDSRYRAA